MRIGLPRALLFSLYFPLWRKLFQELGFEVVTTGESTEALVGEGIKATVPEMCLPIKIYIGHVIDLMKRDIDYIFVPRFISGPGAEWFCPKFIGLPDFVRHTLPDLGPRLLSLDISGGRDDSCDIKDYMKLGDILDIPKARVKSAVRAAKSLWSRFRELCVSGLTLDEAVMALDGTDIKPAAFQDGITVGVLGYVYNVYDKFVSMDIINRLRAMDVNVKTFDMFPESDLMNKDRKSKDIYWVFTRKIQNAAYRLMDSGGVHGLIHVTAFGCGPDSVLGRMLEFDSEREGVPYMTVRVDEHTGENHVQTRLEAFVDMLKRRARA